MSNSPINPPGCSRVARNTAWNLLGTMLPIVVAVFSVPMLIHGLGAPRFGVLTIGWVVMSYCLQFNLGLGRATAKFVAEAIGSDQRQTLPVLIWSSVVAHLLLGVVGGCVLALLTPTLLNKLFFVPADLQEEAAAVFYILALTVPIVLTSDCLRSVLEAQSRFDLVNAVQMPATLWNYLAPIIVLRFYKPDVTAVVALIAISRCAVLATCLALNLRLEPGLRREFRVEWRVVRKMLGFGGWTTVSCLIAPAIASLDRFTIGAVVSLSAVAWYATSYELVTKLWLISGSLLPVLFPVFSSLQVLQAQRIPPLYWRTVTVLLAAVLPIVGVLLMFSPELLGLWVGGEFASHGVPVIQWLAIGMAVNVAAQVPFTLLQSLGKARIPALLQLLELPMYAGAVWLLATRMGITGVAIAWTVRAALDAVVLFAAANWALSDAADAESPRLAWPKFACAGGFLLAFWVGGLVFEDVLFGKLCFGLGLMAYFLMWEWFYLVSEADRQTVLRRVEFAVGRLSGV